MAGELIVKNGLRVSGSTIISGSITATSFTGSFSGSITNAVSASYAATASVLLGSVTSASYALSSSFSSTASYWSGSVNNVNSASFASTSSFPWFQNGANVAYVGGNVGIGTTIPVYKLEIYGNPTNATINLAKSDGDQYLRLIGGSGGANQLIQTAYNLGIDVGGAGNRAMTFLSGSGNVGIGTTNPTTPLYISSSANTGLLIKTPNPTLQLTDASDTWYIQGVSGDRLRVTRGGSADLFTVKSNGDVGIGIGATAPSARLQVRGAGTTSATTALLVENANTSASLLVRGDGRVGLGGITAPSQVLDVSGSLALRGNGIYINSNENYGTARIYISYTYLAGELYIQPSSSLFQNFVFSPNNGMSIGGFTIGGTAGSPPAYGLAVSGSVGIGTRVPAFKLDVSGSGRFTNGLTVTGSIIGTSFTGSLSGSATNAVSASFATTASYWSGSILNATSASFASTASFYGGSVTSASFAATASRVNTLNQNVLITGSLTVGATSPGSSENTLTLGPRDNGGEGGQLMLQAPGGTYTSASMLDNYQNKFRVLRGTNAGSDAFKMQIDMETGQVQIPNYNSPTAFTGAPVNSLATDTNGNLLTVQGYSGIVTINTMPPVNFDIQNGIIVNVF